MLWVTCCQPCCITLARRLGRPARAPSCTRLLPSLHPALATSRPHKHAAGMGFIFVCSRPSWRRQVLTQHGDALAREARRVGGYGQALVAVQWLRAGAADRGGRRQRERERRGLRVVASGARGFGGEAAARAWQGAGAGGTCAPPHLHPGSVATRLLVDRRAAAVCTRGGGLSSLRACLGSGEGASRAAGRGASGTSRAPGRPRTCRAAGAASSP